MTLGDNAASNLREWMDAQNPPVKVPEIADRMGWRYQGVWEIVAGRRAMSDGFKWRFGEVFGFDVAVKLFTEKE